MINNKIMSQIEMNKAVIQRYFDAYNNKNEAIFDEIIAPEYIDHGQSAYMGSPGRGVAGAKNDLKKSLDKLDDLNYVVEAIIASEAYPDLVGAYWKGSLIPKSTSSDIQQTNKKINYRGVSIYRIENGKMVETWHVFDGLPMKLLSA
jgi:predicted ester cyclase